jgi:dTDP-3-amino-3,4,6-trideoxy-alpha-D-glucose transaminase
MGTKDLPDAIAPRGSQLSKDGVHLKSDAALVSPALPAKILLNDFRRQWSDTAEPVLDAVRRVGESGWYILGKEVSGFEASLAAQIQIQNVVGCASGLDAIELALRAANFVAGQRVLTTPLSAFATTLAIVRAGGVPVYVDVDDFGLIDTEQCRDVLTEDRSIRFFVPVHLYGHALRRSALLELQREFELTIVEDCAQAIGAQTEGHFVGSAGEVCAFSFYPTKNLGAMGDAGAVATNNTAIAARCRALRNYGQTERYQHDLLGMNSRLDELHAAILSKAFLPRLAEWTQRRQAIAETYRAGICNPSVLVPGAPEASLSVWHLFPVLVTATRREDFRHHLTNAAVESAIHYPTLIPAQAAMNQIPHQVKRPLTRAERYSRSEVSLPIHPYLTQSEVERVINAVNSWNP